jgi:hypothetical protein
MPVVSRMRNRSEHSRFHLWSTFDPRSRCEHAETPHSNAGVYPGATNRRGPFSHERLRSPTPSSLQECRLATIEATPLQGNATIRKNVVAGVERPRSRVGAPALWAPSAVDAFYSPIPVALQQRIKASRLTPGLVQSHPDPFDARTALCYRRAGPKTCDRHGCRPGARAHICSEAALSLNPGAHLGPYVIEAALGAGGMGSARGCGRAWRREAARVGVGPHAHERKQRASPCR